MAINRDPVLKRCRSLGIEPAFLGYSTKSKKKPNVSRRKASEYSLQLKEKQKTKLVYGVLEKQFRKYFDMASNKKGVTGENLLQILESRLDNVVFRLGFASTRPQARQLVTHGLFEVNGKKVDIPSYLVKPGDVITVKSKSAKYLKDVMEMIDMACAPAWMTIDKDALKITFDRIPEREELDPEIKEQLVIEYYSK